MLGLSGVVLSVLMAPIGNFRVAHWAYNSMRGPMDMVLLSYSGGPWEGSLRVAHNSAFGTT